MGAFDYVTKPLFPEEILITIKKALEQEPLESHPVKSKPAVSAANHTVDAGKNPKELIIKSDYIFGNSAVFNEILQQIKRVSPTNYSIIVYGESGSGKEVIAQTIHVNSKRADKPFVAIDCGALSKELAGSELFGHEKGSFTGALNQKIGSFELANGGTIFLDEIANLSYDIQVSLLRVVQERKIRRIGGTKDIEIDVRIIVASNEKLMDSARKGKFREDLYHRFNEFSIDVPPLRQRKEDLPVFAAYFLAQTCKELDKEIKGLSPQVAQIFMQYNWPGNLRELKNVIKRSVLLTDGPLVEVSVLPFEISNYNKLSFEEPNAPSYGSQSPFEDPTYARNQAAWPNAGHSSITGEAINEKSLKAVSLDAEFNLIVEALKKVNYNKSKAAKILDVDRKTLYNKMKEYKLLKEE
ncbi:two component, sigma54 specific, transcriptional regulator, Fis family [Russula earlei]|uniref:Two component, sigma54 specific, transcriptional regulator, Fis family n=1 Tax=Russula earlei TaxID=71964 RepID=A0ACC0TQN3_9AGAM|nr:two component, sigma54 specific, transcriptional regulator, Fis family [Russula earlei]